MYPKGNIYRSGLTSQGETLVAAPGLVRIGYFLLRGLGAGLIGFAVIAFAFTFGPIVKEEITYRLGKKTMVTPSGFGKLLVAAEIDRVRREAEGYGLNSSFSLIIPKISAKADIIANVDAGDETAYRQALTQGVAHARGTGFPGEGRTVYLFAHSTNSPINFARYNAVFYLLGKLEEKDTFTVFFADRKYEYQVSQKIITGADDTSWLTDTGEGERVILQTCFPPGTTLKRLLLVAKPVI